MNLFNFFKKKKKTEGETVGNGEPSTEQISFAKMVLEIISPTVESFGFVRHAIEIKTYSTNVVYRKGKCYIKIDSTTYPTDYPYHYNIVLGEGDSEDFFDYDWSSIALWQLAKIMDSKTTISSYDFPYNNDIKASILRANADLLKYGEDFLKGELTNFYQARMAINKQREPYKIHSTDSNGNYITTNEPNSVKQKGKYS